MTPDTVSAGPTVGPDAEDQDPFIADLRQIYTDSTLVLVGCGKAKRDPDDPIDVHEAAVPPGEESEGYIHGADEGPAWQARDLYTSNYFASKRSFAERVSAWANDHDGLGGWAILSAEHDVLYPWQLVAPYETKIDDLGEDPTDPEDRVGNAGGRRRPDGQEIVTEMDAWAAMVAAGLARWVASYRDGPSTTDQSGVNSLLVLAGQSYLEPLRDRGVFEYGIARMAGDPNDVRHGRLDVNVRFLFEEIDAGGNGEQMAWLSDATERLGELADPGEQHDLGAWADGERTACERCDVPADEVTLSGYGGDAYCPDCEPRRCGRCGEWTHDNGLGGYPLCPDCQTERGGQTDEPLEPLPGEQGELSGWSE